MVMSGVVGQRAQYVMFREAATGRLLPVSSQPRVLLQWIVQKYPMQVRMVFPAAVPACDLPKIICAHWLVGWNISARSALSARDRAQMLRMRCRWLS